MNITINDIEYSAFKMFIEALNKVVNKPVINAMPTIEKTEDETCKWKRSKESDGYLVNPHSAYLLHPKFASFCNCCGKKIEVAE